jgi:hypothetical protein
MEAVNTLTGCAQHLVALASEPGLHIESSPGAHQALRACVADIERVTGDLSHAAAVAHDPELHAFFLAKLNDVINSLEEMLSAIQSARPLPYVAKEFIAQVGAELFATAREVEQSQTTEGAIIVGAPDRKTAKVIQFPGHSDNLTRSDEPTVSEDEESTPLTEVNVAPETPAIVRSPIRFEAFKRRQLDYRRMVLIEQYEAASKQLSRALSDADKISLRLQIKDLEKEIEQLDQELEERP